MHPYLFRACARLTRVTDQNEVHAKAKSELVESFNGLIDSLMQLFLLAVHQVIKVIKHDDLYAQAFSLYQLFRQAVNVGADRIGVDVDLVTAGPLVELLVFVVAEIAHLHGATQDYRGQFAHSGFGLHLPRIDPDRDSLHRAVDHELRAEGGLAGPSVSRDHRDLPATQTLHVLVKAAPAGRVALVDLEAI